MNKIVADQADGLRRLLAGASVRLIAVTGLAGGVGATSVAMNLAAALAQQGTEVLLLDEHRAAATSPCALWGLEPAATLAHALAAPHPQAVVVKAACGVGVLSALPGTLPDGADPRRLCRGGVILIDAVLDAAGCLSPLAQLADEHVVVFQPEPASLTATYAGLKRLHYAHGLRQFRLLVNGADNEQDATRFASNLSGAATRYLALSLEPAGSVRADSHFTSARLLNQTVTEAYPASAAAVDFRRIAVGVGQWPWRAAPAQSRFIPRAMASAGSRLPSDRSLRQPDTSVV